MGSEARRRLLNSAFANYLGVAVVATLPIVTLPTYVSSLGDLQWGLVGFMGTLQSLLAIIDVGFSQSLIREFAVRLGAGPEGSRRAAALLRECERFYSVVLCTVLAITVLLSGVAADHWLRLPPGNRGLGVMAVVGAGLLCVLYIPGSLYRGVAMAGEEQVRFNVILAAGTILRFGGGAIAVLRWPHFEVYVVWFVLSLGLEVVMRSILAWRVVGGRPRGDYCRGQVRELIGGMGLWTFAAVVGAITIQADKAILSRTMPIASLASYYVASQLAMGILQLFSPMIMAMLPRLLRSAENRRHRSRDQQRLFAAILALGLMVIGVMMLFGHELLRLWIGNRRAMEVTPILTVLLVGVFCNALANVGYVNWLARGRGGKLLAVNAGALLVVSALALMMIPRVGVRGAAIAWSSAQLFVFVMSLDWISDAFKAG